MRVLLLGGGGREHALAWKMTQSPKLEKLYIAPGNAGTALMAENVNIKVNEFEKMAAFIAEKQIDMVVVGPEDPLVNGVRNYLEAKFPNLMIIGPGKDGAELEGSKDFAKAFMMRHGIPTAGYFTVTTNNLKEGIAYLHTLKAPYVLKADGLAAGKGVLIINDLKEAETELKSMLDGKFGAASARVVLEEFLTGIEISVFAITDGKGYKILGSAKDYKRIGDHDMGLNTGGMGAVSPVPFANAEFNKKVEDCIVRPTVEGLQRDKIDYKGFIFFGLMNDNGKPKVIEYNVRMGDPETEVVMPRLKTDLLTVFEAAAKGQLDDIDIEITSEFCTTVMMVSGGYPETYVKGKEMTIEKIDDSLVFHAGTKLIDGKVFTDGGRVITVSSFGTSISDALAKSYANVKKITFDGAYYRHDIGQDLMKY